MGFNKLKAQLKGFSESKKSSMDEILTSSKNNTLIKYFNDFFQLNKFIRFDVKSQNSQTKEVYSEAQLKRDIAIATTQASLLRQLNR